MSRFALRSKPRKLSKALGHGSGPTGRENALQRYVSLLFRYQRIEGSFAKCDETRGYAEVLLERAMKYGPHHTETMELMDHWLLEKDLIHVLFKEYVPRYSAAMYRGKPFTSIYRIQTQPGKSHIEQMGVLELKGNPWPRIHPEEPQSELQLHNVLLNSYFAEKNNITTYMKMKKLKQKEEAFKVQVPTVKSEKHDKKLDGGGAKEDKKTIVNKQKRVGSSVSTAGDSINEPLPSDEDKVQAEDTSKDGAVRAEGAGRDSTIQMEGIDKETLQADESHKTKLDDSKQNKQKQEQTLSSYNHIEGLRNLFTGSKKKK